MDIIHEYTVAAPAAGLSREQIRQAQINGLTTGVPRRTGKSRPHSAGCQRLITGPAAVLPGSSSDQAERGAMSGRLDTQLNQGHYLNRLAGRDRVFPYAVKGVADSGIVGGIITR